MRRRYDDHIKRARAALKISYFDAVDGRGGGYDGESAAGRGCHGARGRAEAGCRAELGAVMSFRSLTRHWFFALLLWAPALALAAPLARVDAEYRLGAGDLLKINVYGYPDMSADVRVDEAGSISYAYVGQLAVGGRSARDVESLVAQKLTTGGFIRSPQVSVLVSDYRSQTVAVMGQVSRPGQYPLRKVSSVDRPARRSGRRRQRYGGRRGDAAPCGRQQAGDRSVRAVRRGPDAELAR